MANPADNFSEVTKSAHVSQNFAGMKDFQELLSFINRSFRFNAIVKTNSATVGGIYTVDIYENSFGTEATKIDLEAIALDEPLRYTQNMPCQVIQLKNDLWGILRPTKFFHFKITNDDYDFVNYSNFIKGIPCNSLGDTVLTQKLVIDLEYNYPSNQVESEVLRVPDPDKIVHVLIYDVPVLYSADNSIAETTSFGLIMSPHAVRITAGELQWQQITDVVANEWGWEFNRVHALPPNT